MMGLDLFKYLKIMQEEGVSDLHLKAGAPPVFRKNKSLVLSSHESEPLKPQDIKEAVYPLLTDQQHEILERDKQVDFSYGVKDMGRFRFNMFFQRGTLRLVIRHIPFEVPSLKELNLPHQLTSLIEANSYGLILVTGATGNGKTSSIVSMIDHINRNHNKHVITIEDPIEFLIKDKKSLITQRELGSDYISYNMALKSTLRQDPDIIFFGELRDEASIETALNAANTGHLVFSTLHTNSVPETITRILGMFNKDKGSYIRSQFASCLKAVICQRLCLRKDGEGFYPALEILVNNPRIREVLADDTKSTSVLTEIIEESKDVWGMQSFNQHLQSLYRKGIISKSEALKNSSSPEKLRLFFEGLSHDNSQKVRSRVKQKPMIGVQALTLETHEPQTGKTVKKTAV